MDPLTKKYLKQAKQLLSDYSCALEAFDAHESIVVVAIAKALAAEKLKCIDAVKNFPGQGTDLPFQIAEKLQEL